QQLNNLNKRKRERFFAKRLANARPGRKIASLPSQPARRYSAPFLIHRHADGPARPGRDMFTPFGHAVAIAESMLQIYRFRRYNRYNRYRRDPYGCKGTFPTVFFHLLSLPPAFHRAALPLFGPGPPLHRHESRNNRPGGGGTSGVCPQHRFRNSAPPGG